jgi:hypothetical protein
VTKTSTPNKAYGWAKGVAIAAIGAAMLLTLAVLGLSAYAYFFPDEFAAPNSTRVLTAMMALALFLSYASQFTGITLADFFRKPNEHPALHVEIKMGKGAGGLGYVSYETTVRNLGAIHAKNIVVTPSENPPQQPTLIEPRFPARVEGLPPDPSHVAQFLLVRSTPYGSLDQALKFTVRVAYEDYHDRKYETVAEASVKDLEREYRDNAAWQ